MEKSMTITKSLKKVIVLGQIFGYFPVQNISDNPEFSWKSVRFFYAVFTIIGPTFLCVLQIRKAVTNEFNVFQVEYVTRYAASTYVGIVFLELARKWNKLMKKWREVEEEMKKYEFPKKLNRTIIFIMIFFVSMLFVEYLLHQASRIYRVAECQEDQEKAIKFFFSNLTLSHVFKYIPYNIPTSLVFQYWLFQIHFAFTYIDLFVMIISLSLASRMKQVTTNIKKTSKKEIADIEVWHQLREDYTRLSNLCHSVNDTISNVILVSFLPNIFTILTQVYNSLKPRQNYVEAIYFYFSLVFLISRTAMVVICGATVYGESRRPLNVLNSVSPKVYNKEIQRLIEQILNFEVSMNGKNFFNIKRHVILEIASAIVTYELVLIQFNREYLNSWAKSKRCE